MQPRHSTSASNRRRCAAALLVGSVCALWTAPAAAVSSGPGPGPEPGRYSARFCVATAALAPGCSPAEVIVGPRGEVTVTLSDLVYRMSLRTGQLDLTLFQGNQRIDGFTALYGWGGRTLHFRDAEKQVTYDIRLENRRRDPARSR